jgi:hypothetical protein
VPLDICTCGIEQLQQRYTYGEFKRLLDAAAKTGNGAPLDLAIRGCVPTAAARG